MASPGKKNGRFDGDWPADLFKQQTAKFHDGLRPKLDTELQPLQDKIGAKKHPWNIIQTLTALGGGSATFGLYQLWESALIPALVASAIGFLSANSVARRKNKLLKAAQSDLNNYMQDAIGLGIYDVSGTHAQSLQTFRSAGMLGRYEDVHYLVGLGPKTDGAFYPQSIGTKLTRTETETYTDSQGRTRTRQRVIHIFEGLLLELDIDGFKSDNRILISSRRTHRPSGIFDRVVNGKRQKLDKIKTSSLTFNKYFKVSTDDQTLAHLFLDPERVMRFNNLYADLQQALNKKRISMSFLISHGRAWIAIETAGLPKLDMFSHKTEKLHQQTQAVLGQAALPHIIAQHLEWPNPMPYAWQDYISQSGAI